MRRATQVCPEQAKLVYSLNLFSNRRIYWLLQIPAALAFFLFGFLFLQWATWVHPGFSLISDSGITITLPGLVLVILCMVIAIVLHELIHGMFFWIFSHSRPRFGFRNGYAFASAPGWFFPRGLYLVIGMSPFVLLSLLGMALLIVVPDGAIFPILFALVINASGAVGDLWITARILWERKDVIIEDVGDGFKMYAVSD